MNILSLLNEMASADYNAVISKVGEDATVEEKAKAYINIMKEKGMKNIAASAGRTTNIPQDVKNKIKEILYNKSETNSQPKKKSKNVEAEDKVVTDVKGKKIKKGYLQGIQFAANKPGLLAKIVSSQKVTNEVAQNILNNVNFQKGDISFTNKQNLGKTIEVKYQPKLTGSHRFAEFFDIRNEGSWKKYKEELSKIKNKEVSDKEAADLFNNFLNKLKEGNFDNNFLHQVIRKLNDSWNDYNYFGFVDGKGNIVYYKAKDIKFSFKVAGFMKPSSSLPDEAKLKRLLIIAGPKSGAKPISKEKMMENLEYTLDNIIEELICYTQK